MKQATITKLDEAMHYCDKHDKSTEFMIQYMQDVAGVSHECVMNYLERYAPRSEEGKL